MGIFTWILFGAIIGWIANALTKKKNSGCISNIAIGMIGSLIGGLIMTFATYGVIDLGTFIRNLTTFNLISFLISILGAVVFLAIVNTIKDNK